MKRPRISQIAYWIGLSAWLLAYGLLLQTATDLSGFVQGVSMAAWLAVLPALMCARLFDAGRPWILGLIPLPAALLPGVAGGMIWARAMRFASGEAAPGWMEPTALGLILASLVIGVVSAGLIGFLPSAPRSSATTLAAD